MYNNFVYPSVTEALPCLLTALHTEGLEVASRVGVTQELTHVGITLTDPLDREILVHGRKANLAAQIAETMWVLSGRDDIAWLENYLPRVRDFSDDGETWRAGYGKRLRGWEDHGHAKTIDQWRWLIEHLTEQPASRRAVMSIWDPTVDTADGKDIPCNDWLSFLSRNGYLDLHVAIRSNDIIWGWSGINQFEWSALLEITAGMLGMKVGSLHFSTTSFHQYDHHFAKGQKIVDAGLTNLDHLSPSPRFLADAIGRNFDTLETLFEHWFQVEYDIRTGSPLVQHYVDTFPEPMLRSWLRILQWWWSEGVRSDEYLDDIRGTRLAEATRYAMQPKRKVVEIDVTEQIQQLANGGDILKGTLRIGELGLTIGHPPMMPGRLFEVDSPAQSDFMAELCSLHLEKEAAYGGSWKKRGELFSILPNVGRKVDRLQGGQTADETTADTAEDLFVYLAKYKTWLNDHYSLDGPSNSDRAEDANVVMREIERLVQGRTVPSVEDLKATLVDMFERLLEMAEAQDPSRAAWVETMLPSAYMLARTLWSRETLSGSLEEYRGADRD